MWSCPAHIQWYMVVRNVRPMWAGCTQHPPSRTWWRNRLLKTTGMVCGRWRFSQQELWKPVPKLCSPGSQNPNKICLSSVTGWNLRPQSFRRYHKSYLNWEFPVPNTIFSYISSLGKETTHLDPKTTHFFSCSSSSKLR
jgi:hypothetical protein